MLPRRKLPVKNRGNVLEKYFTLKIIFGQKILSYKSLDTLKERNKRVLNKLTLTAVIKLNYLDKKVMNSSWMNP